jgi:hypothetical protein
MTARKQEKREGERKGEKEKRGEGQTPGSRVPISHSKCMPPII